VSKIILMELCVSEL